MACFGEFMPHRIAGGGRKGKVHKDNIRVQFCMLYFAWEQHLFLLSFSSEVKPRGPPDVQIPLHRITDSASNGSVFPVVTEHFSASSDHAFL